MYFTRIDLQKTFITNVDKSEEIIAGPSFQNNENIILKDFAKLKRNTKLWLNPWPHVIRFMIFMLFVKSVDSGYYVVSCPILLKYMGIFTRSLEIDI